MKIVLLTEETVPVLYPGVPTVVIRGLAELQAHRDADLFVDLDFDRIWARGDSDAMATRLAALEGLLPSLVIVNAVIPTTGEIGRPFIRMNGWSGFPERAVHELALPDAGVAQLLARHYEAFGRAFREAPDVCGMITPRILASIINEAWYTWQQGVSSKEEIDTAMKLGTNYPMGPFEWGEQIGLENLLYLLEALSREDPRYIPAKTLKDAVEEIKI